MRNIGRQASKVGKKVNSIIKKRIKKETKKYKRIIITLYCAY